MIIDEKLYAEQIIEKQEIDKNHDGYDLSILAKYYVYNGYDYKKTRKLLEEFCLKNIKYFNIVTRYSLIDYAIKQSKNYKLNVPIEIIITQQEMSAIQQVENIDYQRFLFTILILAKEQKYNSPKIKYKNSSKLIGIYYNGEIKEVFRHAQLKWGRVVENKMIHKLYKLEYLDIIPPHGSIVIKYALEGYPAIIINDFRNIGLQYLKFIGNKKVEKCEDCGSVFLRRSKLQVLCSTCYEEHRREISREIMRKNYKKP